MAWFAPGKDPTKPWEMHAISDPASRRQGTDRFAHGLGVGDVNGDGRLDVICTGGWWEQPAKDDGKSVEVPRRPTSGGGCADMYALDIDGDGKPDVISSSAHQLRHLGLLAKARQRGQSGVSPSKSCSRTSSPSRTPCTWLTSTATA